MPANLTQMPQRPAQLLAKENLGKKKESDFHGYHVPRKTASLYSSYACYRQKSNVKTNHSQDGFKTRANFI